MLEQFTHIFPRANLTHDWKCPICDKSTDKPVVLFPIKGTGDGSIVEAKQIHADCLEYGLATYINKMGG